MTNKVSITMKRKDASPYLFLLPFFLIYGMFNLFPALYSLMISFTKWDGVKEMQFVGLSNYIRLFTNDPMFGKALFNTILFLCIGMPLQVITGLLLAVLLKDLPDRVRSIFQLFNFLPYLTIPVSIGILFQVLFDWKYGVVNQLLQAAHIIEKPINWLGTPAGARSITILLAYWKYFGYMMVIFLAGLSTIPNELYEAAEMDGARWKDKFFHITLPLLRPILTFVVTTSIMGGFQFFDEPRLLFSGGTSNSALGGPDRSVLTVIMYFYNVTFERFDYGYGAAIAYGLFAVIFVVSLLSMRAMTGGDKK